MPYNIKKTGSQYQVVGPTGKVHGTHPSKADAREQQKALYANTPAESMAPEPAPKKISSPVALPKRRKPVRFPVKTKVLKVKP
jgi:hypothetical protein